MLNRPQRRRLQRLTSIPPPPIPTPRNATFKHLTIARHPDNVFSVTIYKPPETGSTWPSRCGTSSRSSGHDAPGVDHKFWCTRLELDEPDHNPYANADGFYPLLATLLDYPFPTIGLLTGPHVGGRGPVGTEPQLPIMDVPPINLGLHFDGIGARRAQGAARGTPLDGHRGADRRHRRQGLQARAHGGAHDRDRAAARTAATMGVYGLLRSGLWARRWRNFAQSATCIARELGRQPRRRFEEKIRGSICRFGMNHDLVMMEAFPPAAELARILRPVVDFVKAKVNAGERPVYQVRTSSLLTCIFCTNFGLRSLLPCPPQPLGILLLRPIEHPN